MRAIVTEPPPEGPFVLTYHGSPGGSIVGATPQQVAPGAAGSTIFAAADAGAVLLKWCDGSTANPRIEENVRTDLEVTAFFRTIGGVDPAWYASQGITRGDGETWADLDERIPPGKSLSLRQHFIAMLDPHEPASRFAAGRLRRVGHAFEIPFHPSSADRRYTLWRSDGLDGWKVRSRPGATPGRQRTHGRCRSPTPLRFLSDRSLPAIAGRNGSFRRVPQGLSGN